MWAQLGDIVLEGLVGFSSMSHNRETDYAEHALIEGKPRLQLIGRKLDQVQASMYVHAAFTNVAGLRAQLEEARSSGTVLPLITGAGDVVGNFVLKSTKTGVETTDRQGRVISCNIELDMLELSTPELAEQQRAAVSPLGFALSSALPVTVTPAAVQLGSLASRAVATLNSSTLASQAILERVGAAQINPTLARSSAFSIGKVGNLLSQNLGLLKDIVDGDPATVLFSRTRELSAFLPGASAEVLDMVGTATALVSAADGGNQAGVNTALQVLTNQATGLGNMDRDLRRLSTGMVALFASRR